MVIGTVSEANIRYPLTDQSPATSRVTLSQADTILAAQGALMPFASKPEASPELRFTIGSSFWRWVSDRTTQHLLNMMLQRLRAARVAMTLPYRCDTADFRLYMEADLIPLADGHVEVTSRTLRSEPKGLSELAPVPPVEELLRICSWCKRIHIGEWVQPELAIKWLRLLERSSLPELSHGICEECRESTMASIRQRRKNNCHQTKGSPV